MKILITGIGCIGKSTLRERLASNFPDHVISVDMDYDKQIPSDNGKVVIVESVHGLENNPESFDRIIYLLPPPSHVVLWLKRGWAWFASGIVDLSAPKGRRAKFSLSNIPIISKIVLRNIFRTKKWINVDLDKIKSELKDQTYITSSIRDGYLIIKSWIINQICYDLDQKTMEEI